MTIKNSLLFFLCCWPGLAFAQSFYFRYDQPVKVTIYGRVLSNAWSGGTNAAQFSTIHLNGDNLEDLVVFDRTNSKISTFLVVAENGNYTYRHAPEYEFLFPELTGWMLLADYDGDGKKDLFAHTNLGITVYRNATDQGRLRWEVAADYLSTEGLSGEVNMQIPITDIPAIVDLDDDGDLDVLAFDFAGGYIQFQQNMSMERYGNVGHLEFKRRGDCWGDFALYGCADFGFGIGCRQGGRIASGARTDHQGSTLLVLDLNGDRQKDILVGEVSCNQLYALLNQGSNLQASFQSFSNHFPLSHPIDFLTFPAVFYEDMDFDGQKDLVATPNVFSNEGNQIDFVASNHFYRNTGTSELPVFEYQQSDFLQRDMIDLGENAAPALADYDGDGDLDLFVGSDALNSYSVLAASVSLFVNNGSATSPSFEWRTDNYLDLRKLQLNNLRPFFADLNQDGSLDFAFTGNQDQTTQVQYFPNQAARSQAFQFDGAAQLFPLPLAFNENPFLYDADKDGDLDLLVGKPYGTLAYYQNTGSTAQPNFKLDISAFTSIAGDPSKRGLVPVLADLNNDGKPELLTGDRSGQLTVYAIDFAHRADSLLPLTDLVLDSLERNYRPAKLGALIFPVAADLNGDHLPEILTGTNAGGLILLQNTTQSGGNIPLPTDQPLAYPNPVIQFLYMFPAYDCQVEIFNVLGQSLISPQQVKGGKETSFDLSYLANGMYFVRTRSQQAGIRTQRFVVRK